MAHSISIGIDTHAKKNSVCALNSATGEILQDTLPADPDAVIRWIKKNELKDVVCCYEAGPTGFGLARALLEAGIECKVAATSKLPHRSDRKKNDKIDAEWLARMLAAGTIRPVHIPTREQESLAHLSRLRGEIAADLRAARQRVVSFLLLTSTSYTLTKKRWTKTFRQWAETYEFAEAADTFVFRQKLASVYRLEEQLASVEDEIMRCISASAELSKRMARLESIHGIGPVTAFSFICEVYDFERFSSAHAFAAYLGLVPSENSSGNKTRRGSISKTGNSHLRRILIEVANVYSKPYKLAKEEDERIPALVRATAQKCRARLKKRHHDLLERGLNANKVKVAIARELSEWMWHIAVMPA